MPTTCRNRENTWIVVIVFPSASFGGDQGGSLLSDSFTLAPFTPPTAFAKIPFPNAVAALIIIPLVWPWRWLSTKG
jgi:hypothetical protein